MITFKNITGNKFLAVGTIQRKSALNGEKSLTGTLYDGDDVLNKIDKGWSLEFDNEPYIVTYFERNDNDNSVSFDAIHNFFWDMAKNVLYSETSGSHTIKWYLDQIFADAGYTYALNFNPNAIAKDNWGMKNKLSLFNDIITSIEGEFEINGTLVSIFKNIGMDLSTIVRYGFNLSDMTIENDASGFVTYGEGFGAYADQENMTGDRLHVTYTSPLASVYGKLQAEPIDDQRYTIESNLLDAVKSQVDGSFSISVNLSLYDLSVAGYPYKMANVGDWLTAVDENLDFKQRIRIISIDDAFAADGTRISYSVTAGDIGLTKKYQDANASIANKVENAVISAGQAATDANIALIAANGKNKSYYLNDINDLPKTANEGDLAWVQSGDGRVLYIYTKKADGTYYWEKRIDPEIGEQIEAGVNEAIAQANENTATAIEQNNASQQEVMNDIAKSQADLAIKDGDFNNKAQAMADEALANAKANTAMVAKETLDTATDNLNTAKQSLTTDLQTEISDRTNAVAALDIKANGYADQAKQDAIDAATTADGTINKKIDDTATSLTSKITQNQQDAEGKITTAQSTATQALTGLSSKVDTSTYNAKTGQLSTDVTNVTQTANQAKTDIASIKQTDTTQDARMTTIEADADGTKTTVSNLQKAQNTQSGSISTLQQRADGFDATVAKVDNLSVGGRNYVQNSSGLNGSSTVRPTLIGASSGTNVTVTYPSDGILMTNGATNTTTEWYYQVANAWANFSATPLTPGKQITFSADVIGTVPQAVLRYGFNGTGGKEGFNHFDINNTSWTRVSITVTSTSTNTGLYFRIQGGMNNQYTNGWSGGETLKFRYVKIEDGNTPTAWTPAPEDGEQATAKAQLTADTARTEISNYKTDADGRISKAQSDVTQTANQVATKVSQSDYDKKTGQLSTDVSNAQQTANSAVTTIGSYKTSNDNRVAAAETKISQNANDITLRATKTDLDNAKSDYTAKISQVNIDIDGINSSVSNVTNKLSSLPYISENLMKNSSFEMPVGTLSGPISVVDDSDQTRPLPFGRYMLVVDNASNQTAGDVFSRISIDPVILKANQMYTLSYYFSTAGAAYYQHSDYGVDDSGNFIFGIMAEHDSVDVTGGQMQWKRYSKTFKLAKDVTLSALRFGFVTNKDGRAWKVIDQVKIEQGDKATPYTPNVYDNDYRISSQQITIDGITNAVTQQGKDINSVTSRVQTAEGTLSTATDNISGMQTNITQTSNQISQEITDRANGDSNTLQSSKDFTQSSITSAVSGLNSTISQTASGILAQVESTNMVVNSEFDPLNGTWYALSNGGSTGSQLAEAWNAPKASSFADWPVVNGSRIISYAVGTWYTSALVTASAGKVFSASIVAGRSPAPTVSTALDYRIGFWDSSRKLLTTASAGNIIDGTAYKGIQKYVVENKTAPANTAFVSVIIAHSSANVTDYITRPSLNMGAKASPYTPTYGTSSSSTVLSLFKDNWSIGITDNIGAITSGIVGNNNSMSLISKNVIIDSPSTQITGTAWINSAMIKNGSIGTAQIGDASITSAKIISLDVARLTGNVSNFIQSNWNGIYGSTYITADGMSVSSGTVTTSFGAQGMRITMASNGGVVIQGSTKLNGTQTGVLIGMNVGSTFTSFGFQSSSNYLYNDEMVILKTGSAAAGDYNIGGGVAFNHNVSFMDNIYMKYGKGFYGKWGDPQQAIFFQTINSGIPAIMHISGAGIAFGHKGDLYMLSHGGYQDFNNSSIKGSYTVDQPWITG